MGSDTLKIKLDLTIKTDQFSIVGGCVKSVRLDLQPYGFDGEVTFWVASDQNKVDHVLPRFVTADLIEVGLSIESVVPPASTEALVVHGLATDKWLHEISYADAKGNPVLLREYTVRFCDPARLLWRQHVPLMLYTDATMADVLAEHLSQGISLDVSCDDAQLSRPMLCIGLEEGCATFYDFVLWYADRFNATFFYDYKKAKYCLANDKPKETTTASLKAPEVEKVRVHFPETPRRGARLLNGHAEAAKTIVIAQDQAATGMYRDALARTPVLADLDARKTLESSRLKLPLAEVEIDFVRFPSIPARPGARVALANAYFSADLLPVGNTYRQSAVSLFAEVEDNVGSELNATERKYKLQMRARWETELDKVPRLPAFAAPVYPVVAEGKIVCEGGQEGDRSYMSFDDSATSQSFYKVQVPLWNKKITVPFQPQFSPGHFFAPAFKDSRVLLALHFDHAEILQFLDWGADVRLPSESQGNHLLFGKNKTSQTSLKHVYVDEKPAFSVARSSNGDLQTMTLSEGLMFLELKVDTSQQSANQTVDLTGQVAAAQADLQGSTQGSLGQMTASFQQSKGELRGKIDDATTQTSASLDAMEQGLKTKAATAKAQLQASLSAVDAKTSALSAQASGAIAELKTTGKL